jgi:hypothetical protein
MDGQQLDYKLHTKKRHFRQWVGIREKAPRDSTGEDIFRGMPECGRKESSHLFFLRVINHSRTRAAKTPTITAAIMEICATISLPGKMQELCKEIDKKTPGANSENPRGQPKEAQHEHFTGSHCPNIILEGG